MPRRQKSGPRTLLPSVPLKDDHPLRGRTYPGQASFAERSDRVCRECNLFLAAGRYASGRLQNGICNKTKAMGLKNAPAFPGWAFACKYFEENVNPPPMFKD